MRRVLDSCKLVCVGSCSLFTAPSKLDLAGSKVIHRVDDCNVATSTGTGCACGCHHGLDQMCPAPVASPFDSVDVGL